MVIAEIAESPFWERSRDKLLINHPRRGFLSFCRRVIRMSVLILVIYPTINSLELETLLKNVLVLKHKWVAYHLLKMWTAGLGPMTIYLLRWVSGGKKRSFFGKFGVLCILVTSVLRFALLPYYRRNAVSLVVLHRNTSTTIFSQR